MKNHFMQTHLDVKINGKTVNNNEIQNWKPENVKYHQTPVSICDKIDSNLSF